MARSREVIEEQYKRMKIMIEAGCQVNEISKVFNLSINSVYNTFNFMGDSLKRTTDESNLTYAVNKPPVFEKIIINGKRYTDITPLFSPR